MRTKQKRKRKYKTFTVMTIEDDLGTVTVEKCQETGELSFMCPSSIDGNKLTEIKQKNEDEINDFRTGGYQGETQ